MPTLTDFLHILEIEGFEFHHHDENKINRCTTDTSKSGAKPAWFLYRHYNNNCYGVYGDFRTGVSNYYPTDIDKKERKMLFESLSTQDDSDILSLTFNYILNTADEVTSHPYLEQKHIAPDSVKSIIKQRGNRLLIPVMNRNRLVCGIQYIFSEKLNGSDKKFETGSILKGSFFIFPSENRNKIIVCEGFATGYAIWKSTGYLTFVAFSAGNLDAVTKLVREKFPHQKIIIGADNDRINPSTQLNTGVAAARAVVGNISNSLFVSPNVEGTDFNDIYTKEGGQGVKKFFDAQVSSLLQWGAKFIAANWLIQPYLETNTMFIIYGQPNHGKSFFALYLALKASNNQLFYHNEFKNDGAVLYICGEDFNGVNRRVMALCDRYNLLDENFIISTKEVHFLNDEAISELVDDLQIIKNEGKKIKLIIIDTLNANFGDGDENKTVDATRFVNACKKITALFENCSIGIVHHTGHEHKDRPRGASSLIGAANTMMLVNTALDGNVHVSCTKQKNAPKFDTLTGKIVNHKFNYQGQPLEAGVFVEAGDSNIAEEVITDLIEDAHDAESGHSFYISVKKMLVSRTRQSREIDDQAFKDMCIMAGMPSAGAEKRLKEMFLTDGILVKKVGEKIFLINT